jgi:hypothetical protein
MHRNTAFAGAGRALLLPLTLAAATLLSACCIPLPNFDEEEPPETPRGRLGIGRLARG